MGDAPGPVEPAETLALTSKDGTSLYGEWFPPDSSVMPVGAALIVHGFLEHCARYREVAHVLGSLGMAVLSFDLRGHGRSDGQRGYIDSVSDFLDDLDAALCELVLRIDRLAPERELPVVLVGHSNGGLVVLRALADPTRQHPRVRAAVVSSPFLGFRVEVPVPKKLLALAASRWVPRLSLPNQFPLEWLTADPDKQRERRLDTLCHEVASARWYTATLEAQEYVADYAVRITVPTLWLVSAEDRLADPGVTRMVHARLRAPSEYHDLLGLQHEVFNERDRGRVFGLLGAFMRRQLESSGHE